MKKFVGLVGVGIAALVFWLSTRLSVPAQPFAGVSAPDDIAECDWTLPHGKVLYVVIDVDGAYFGSKRFDVRFAKDAVNTILKEEKIRNLVIYGTDVARYGDVIELYAAIDPTLIRWSTFSLKSLAAGSRKPLTGFYRPRCCHSVDVENEAEAE
jgi:hypothetical protein